MNSLALTNSWDDIRFFLAVVEYRTVSGAAAALSVQHTTVSRRISSLESALQIKLFDRLPTGWVLTDTAQDLLLDFKAVGTQAAKLFGKAKCYVGLRGSVSISAPPLLISHFLSYYFQDLQSQFPDVSFSWHGDRKQLNLDAGECDIALRMGELADSELKARSLGVVRYGVYRSKTSISSGYDTPVVLYTSSALNLRVREWYDNTFGDKLIYTRTDDFLTAVELLKSAKAAALLPRFLGDQITGLQLDDCYTDIPSVQLSLLMQRDIAKGEHIQAVKEALLHIFNKGF